MTKAQAQALARLPSVAHVELDGEVHALNDSAQASFGVTKARIDDPALDGDGDGNPSVYSPVRPRGGRDRHRHRRDPRRPRRRQGASRGRTTSTTARRRTTTTATARHVSGTIAGDGDGRADHLYHGIAPAAGLIGLKVLNSAGSGSFSNVISALDWIVANKTPLRDRGRQPLARRGRLQQRHRPDLAGDRSARSTAGIVVAVAAGNAGPGTCTVGTPGAAPAALTVGAMTDLGPGGFYLASFSSRGPTSDGRIKPDVVAPGVSVTSSAANTTNGYSIYSGTSMATPFVVGVSLLMRDANPSLTPQQIKDAMTSTAEDWGPAGRRHRLRRRPARRLRGAALGRRAARRDRRRRCRRTPSAAARSPAPARAPTSRSTSPTRSTRSRRR